MSNPKSKICDLIKRGPPLSASVLEKLGKPWRENLTFGQRLRIARRKAGLSIDEAASLLHRTPRLWKYWESDERTPKPEAKVITQEKLFRTLEKVQEINKGEAK